LELNQIGITKLSTLYAFLSQTFQEYSADSDDYEDEDEWQEALEEHETMLSELAQSGMLYAEVTHAAEKSVLYAQDTLELMRALRKSIDLHRGA